MDTLIRNFLKEHILFKDYANEEFVTLLAKQMKPRMFVDGAYIIRKVSLRDVRTKLGKPCFLT
jgi:hypothetical protein